MDNQKITKLTQKMVHDVRTPLTIFNMLYSSWQTKLADTADNHEELNIFKEEIQKIDSIVSAYKEKILELLK